MGRRRHRSQTQGQQHSGSGPRADSLASFDSRRPRGSGPAVRDDSAHPSPLVTSRRPILRFVLALVGLLAVFNYLYYVAFVRSDLLRHHLETTAQLTGVILRFLGDEVRVTGTHVAGRFPMEIDTGCDALQAVAFFVFGVAAVPLRLSLVAKAVSCAIGAVLLMFINLVRISSLYYVGVFFPASFETVHIDVWQTAFIFLPICLWLVWAWWAIRRGRRRLHALA